jgi:hypothetical protein
MCPRLPDNMDRGPSTSLLRVGSQLKFYADLRFPLPNKITGANAGGPRQLAMRTRWAARVAQFWRSAASEVAGGPEFARNFLTAYLH